MTKIWHFKLVLVRARAQKGIALSQSVQGSSVHYGLILCHFAAINHPQPHTPKVLVTHELHRLVVELPITTKLSR